MKLGCASLLLGPDRNK